MQYGDVAEAPLPPGVSAAAAAAALRVREELAEIGPRGERATERILAPLRRKGFIVLTDALLPNSQITIDHIVIGRNGVTVVESRYWRISDVIRQSEGKLFVGPTYRGEEVDHLYWVRNKVAREAELERYESARVQAIMCIHGAPFDDETVDVDGAIVASPRALLFAVHRPKPLLPPPAVAEVAEAVMEVFRPRHGGRWPAELTPQGELVSPRGERRSGAIGPDLHPLQPGGVTPEPSQPSWAHAAKSGATRDATRAS